MKIGKFLAKHNPLRGEKKKMKDQGEHPIFTEP